MSKDFTPSPFRHGLTFVATIAFVASFFGSRLFSTFFPNTIVQNGDIHLHHFWYGIGLISAAGWMGIAWRNERFYRLYAVLYGLGAGLAGDEVGLLLTFRDYQSQLTYQFFVAAISFIIIATLLFRYRGQLQRDVLRLAVKERLTLVGVYLAGFSAYFFIFLSSGISLLGIPLALAGLGILVIVYARRKKTRSETSVPTLPSN